MRMSLHNHCFRCGHASGKEEEYILQAIDANISIFGMSEHVPYPDGYRIRMPYWQLDDYLNTMSELKRKYVNSITIYTGFECEYELDRLPLYEAYLNDPRVDYLILGHHYPKGEDSNTYFANIKNDEHLEQYVLGLEQGMETGLFKFVAHPDLFLSRIENLADKHIKVIHRICTAAKKNNLPLEFNANGIRRGKVDFDDGTRFMYPDLRFWEIAKTYNIKVIISSDAHRPEHVYDEHVDYAFFICKELGLNVIEKLSLK